MEYKSVGFEVIPSCLFGGVESRCLILSDQNIFLMFLGAPFQFHERYTRSLHHVRLGRDLLVPMITEQITRKEGVM